MDKELVVLYEAAKKVADAAASEDGGSAEESRCLDALRELKDFPVNYKILVETQVGKRLRHLTKHPRKKIQAYAAELIDIWKNIIIEETTRNKKNESSDGEVKKTPNSVKIEKTSQPEIVKREKVEQDVSPRPGKKTSRPEIVKNQSSDGEVKKKSNSVKIEKTTQPEIVKREKVEQDFSPRPGKKVKPEDSSDMRTDNGHSVKIETMKQEEKKLLKPAPSSSVSNGPPKLTSMIKCSDEARDNVRKILCESLSRVSGESDESIKEDVDACDPIRVAVTVESVMFETWGKSTGPQKAKYRSVIFNLKDPKNPDFRRKVLLGHVWPEIIPTLTPEDMASDRRRMENQQIKEKAMFECERGMQVQPSTDEFKCGRCKKRMCTYYQLQTRSADEPMTTFVTCVNCNNHWKFC